MIESRPSLSLNVRLTEEQLGFLDYLYPNVDPEDALIRLLERARNRAIRKAEQQVHILHPRQEEAEQPETSPDQPISQVDEQVKNPIGQLQELCQKQQISLPRYEFSEISEGFRCLVQSMGLQGVGEGASKKKAKMGAAEMLLKRAEEGLCHISPSKG
ncbi:double-stranded RNA binding motif domain-containing protein [Acaryochloris marina]|uniref:double-stranded RNA binding motif domain-containing protein n=1 Tax=Acaryochloris marina TaxID=155978 RepID=UPI0021C48A66|nr:double-stranded RNA binding motif domain-containing protein [Acaryochloris marina]BDM83621.1 hypothetical protein AM10699_64820 [Acaryochloris marina MBIC10699]